jgi:hypothetical protein
VSFALVLAFLLVVVVLLPFALASLLNYMFRPQSNQIYQLIGGSETPATDSHARLHLDFLALDEWSRTIQFRVAGSHICQTKCVDTDRNVFVASPESGDLAEGLPPSETVEFPPGGQRVTKLVTLPVVGQPLLFPFDSYRLGLGLIAERVSPDGTVQMLSQQEAVGHVFVSLQTHVVRTQMTPPATVTAAAAGLESPDTEYVQVSEITFARPLHLQVLTVLLVLLVIVAAIYAVFLRPLRELVINAGALVLGVWGIRAILLGSSPPGATLVDLVLSMVILFLLVAIVLRALWYHRAEGNVRFRKAQAGPPADETPDAS